MRAALALTRAVAALGEARAIYAELGATRWLARVDAMTGLAA